MTAMIATLMTILLFVPWLLIVFCIKPGCKKEFK